MTLKKIFEVKLSWKFSFLKIYVMGSTQVDFLDIVHVKVGFFAVLKMCVRVCLGKFVWSTLFVQCEVFLVCTQNFWKIERIWWKCQHNEICGHISTFICLDKILQYQEKGYFWSRMCTKRMWNVLKLHFKKVLSNMSFTVVPKKGLFFLSLWGYFVMLTI